MSAEPQGYQFTASFWQEVSVWIVVVVEYAFGVFFGLLTDFSQNRLEGSVGVSHVLVCGDFDGASVRSHIDFRVSFKLLNFQEKHPEKRGCLP